MSNDTPTPPDSPPPQAQSKLPPAVRQRLDQVFQHARRSFDKGDHDYAHDLYAQCVAEDPANLVYAQHFRANLTKKFGAGKKSSSFGGLLNKTSRGAVEKAASKGKWEDAFAAGCAGLKKNPGDIGTLQAMGAACGELEQVECQLFYLRWAMDVDPTDIESNRQAAAALATIGEFDQAIACWKRVQQQKPNDEEAAKQIARLSVEKTIHQGGYNTDLLKKDDGETTITTPRVADLASKQSDGTPRERTSTGETTLVEGEEAEEFDEQEKRLLAKIADSPGGEANYLELAELYAAADRLQDAERLLSKALTTIGNGDSVLRERLEDIHLRRVRRQVEIAHSRFEKQRTPEAKELVARMAKQANQAELEVYTARAGRSPGDTRLQFELGLRQKRVSDYRAAIHSFQAARGDSQRAAETQILLGECFQHIDQYKLAISSYEAAVEASKNPSAGGNEEVRKLALYRVGVLAMGLKDYDRADQRLTELAALDFSYRDVADRLDKIAAMRNDT